jgi:hypothetical protein
LGRELGLSKDGIRNKFRLGRDISDALRELGVTNEEMKGLCLSVQFKAYCGVGEEVRLLS